MSKIKSICGIILCSLLLFGCSSEEPENVSQELQTPSAVNYQTTTAEYGTFQITQKNGGTLVYPVTQSVSCEYDHAVLKEKITVKRGDEVKEGDVIATFTFDVSQAELEELELAYRDAVNSFESKQKEYQTKIAGYDTTADGIDGQIAALQKKQTENELELYKITAEQNLEELKKSLEEYRLLFSEQVVTAPCDGIVSSVASLTVGHAVSKGTDIVEIYSPDTVYFKLKSPSKSFLQLAAPCLSVTITFRNGSCTGHIASTPTGIDAVIDNRDIYISIDRPQDITQDNSLSTECVTLELQDVLLLDRTAVRHDDDIDYVYILEDGTSLKRNVLCGPENSDVVCILDGLSEGQQVILN